MPMFKYSIAIEKSEVLIDAEDDSVGNLKVIESKLIAKENTLESTAGIIQQHQTNTGEIAVFKSLIAVLRDIKESNRFEGESTDSKMLVSEVVQNNSSVVFDSNFGTTQIDGCTTIIYNDPENSVLDPSESSSQTGMI